LAESIVPDTLQETEALIERINVPRENYKNDADYQQALRLHRQARAATTRLQEMQYTALVGAYERKFGVGSYERDLAADIVAWDKNLKEMFGDSRKLGMLFGSDIFVDPQRGAQIKAEQMTFLTWYAQHGTNQGIKQLIPEVMQQILRGGFNMHPLFFDRFENPIAISPVEYIMARLFMEFQMDTRTGMMPRNVPRDLIELPRLIEPPIFGYGPATRDIAINFLDDFAQFSSLLTSRPRVISREQIEARLDFAIGTGSRYGIFAAMFPGRKVIGNVYLDHLMEHKKSEDPRDIAMLRTLMERTLQNNPEFLFAVRKFGHPVIQVPHRQYTFLPPHPDFKEKFVYAMDWALSPAEKIQKETVGLQMLDEFERYVRDAEFDNQLDFDFGASGLLGFRAALGGTLINDTHTMMLTPAQLVGAILAPTRGDQGIVEILELSSISHLVGEAAVPVHEFGHWVDLVISNTLYSAMWVQAQRDIDNWITTATNNGTYSSPGLQRYVRQRTIQFRDDMKQMDGLGRDDGQGGREVVPQRDKQKRMLIRLKRDPTVNQQQLQGQRFTPDEVPSGPQLALLPELQQLDDFQLNELITDLRDTMSEIHGDTTLLDDRQQGLGGGFPSPRDTADASKLSPEPFVVTPYGASNTMERFAESGAAVLTRAGQKYPVLVNNAAVKMWARILGINTEAQDVTSLSRRRRLTRMFSNIARYAPDREDISDRILSDIKIVAPGLERTPTGHRPGMPSSTSSQQLLLDPDERSMLRSRSLIGLEATDERLYAYDTPITVMDFASRPRVYSIGDYHFYDPTFPYASGMATAVQRRLGDLAGRRFVNRNRPHHGDLVRAISATQFGFFIDDMPTYDTTTAGQMKILRGFVTGRIAKLNPVERGEIEEALRDATRIHSAIQNARLTKRDLYRSVQIDEKTLLESISVGDKIPMPITAFSPERTSATDKSVIMRLESGAKAIPTNNNQMLTQGNFEITDIKTDGAQVVVTLRHQETFDPRHDALRPVDKFAHKPNAMRKMGSAMPRYTSDEASKMEVDLQRRKDRNEAFGLRSTTSTAPTDEEIIDFIESEAKRASGERAERARGTIIEKTKAGLRDYVRTAVGKRLSKARESIIAKHGTARPWKADADAIRKWRAIDKDTQMRAASTLERMIEATIDAIDGYDVPDSGIYDTMREEFISRGDKGFNSKKKLFTDWLEDPEGFDLSSSQIRHLLETGELVYWRRGKDPMPLEHVVVSLPMLIDKEIIDGTKKETFGMETSYESITELRRILETNLKMLEATERAYLMDGSVHNVAPGDKTVFEHPRLSGKIMSDGVEWTIAPKGKGVYTVFRKFHGGAIKVDATFGVGRSSDFGSTGFTREIFVDTAGNINVIHERLWMGSGSKIRKNTGVGTLLNQHAFLWWKQHEGTEVSIPNPASDGVLVWPRLGFKVPEGSDTIGNQRAIARRAQKNFTAMVREIVLRGMNVPDSDIDSPYHIFSPDEMSTRVRADFGLSRNPEMRDRLMAWLALAREAEVNGVIDTDLITLLANVIEPRELNSEQRDNWNFLFADLKGVGGYSLFLNETEDDDYLPSFVIKEPTEGMDATEVTKQIERADLLNQELIDAASPESVERNIYFPDQTDASQPLLGLNVRQVSRLMSVVLGPYGGDRGSMRNEMATIMLAREGTGASGPPRLMTRLQMVERINNGETPLYGFVRPDSDWSDRMTREIIVNGSGSAEMMQFTNVPFEHLDKFYDTGSPISDPAQTKTGMLGYLAPWARVFRSDDFGAFDRISLRDGIWGTGPDNSKFISRSVEDTLKEFVDVRNFIGLMDMLIKLHGEEYDDGAIKLLRFKDVGPSVGGTTGRESEVKKSVKRLISSLFDIQNNIRMEQAQSRGEQTPTTKQLKQLRNELLKLMVDPRGEYGLVALLGYDAVQTRAGITRVINNAAMEIMDEPVSFGEAVKLVDDPRFRDISNARNLGRGRQISNSLRDTILRRLTTNPDWFDDDEPRLFEDDDLIILPRQGVRSSTYIRAVRQDHNINLEKPLRNKRGLKSKGPSIEQRERRREAQKQGWIEEDDNAFKDYIVDLESRYNGLAAQIEQLDAEQPDDDASVDDDLAWLDKREQIRQQMDEIADEFASLIETSNLVVETAIEHEAAIAALSAILNERDSEILTGQPKVKDLPEEMVRRLTDLRDKLVTEQNYNPQIYSVSRARARRRAIDKALDNFDLQFDVRWFDDEQVELELSEITQSDVLHREEALIENIYRGLLDPNYEAWERRYRVVRDGRFVIRDADDVMAQRIRDLFADVTRDQREEWSRAHNEFLNNVYNMEYVEDIIDANPVGGSTRPRDVPAPVWRKVRAAMKRARSTPFDGEKEAAKRAAMRLLTPHRPDLANDNFIDGIRSSTTITPPRSHINISVKEFRGSSPESPAIPPTSHTISRVAEKMREQGFDVTEADLLPTGRVGRKVRMFFGANFDDEASRAGFALDADPEVRAAIDAVTAEARKTMRSIEIEGHVVKKILGPLDEELSDLFGDDIDIGRLVTHGAPSYEQLNDIIASWYIQMERLNKMFGAYEQDDGKIIGAGYIDLIQGENTNGRTSAYLMTMKMTGEVKKKKTIFRDIRGNVVAEFDRSKPERINELLEMIGVQNVLAETRQMDTLNLLLRRSDNAQSVNTNDAIFGVMADMVGLTQKRQPYYPNASLATLRNQIEALKELYGRISFAPTPAGKHLRELFESRIEMKMKNLEIVENIGRRYVHLLKERGLTDDDISEMLSTLLDSSVTSQIHRGGRSDFTRRVGNDDFMQFKGGEPVPATGASSNAARDALRAFVYQKAVSALVPVFNDGDTDRIGMHEIGHFVFGQAFTRHGEFVANAWTYLLFGQSHWSIFAENQRQQSDFFDALTIKEHFGRLLSPDLRAAIKGHSKKRYLDILAGLDGGKHLNITNKDALQMLDDVITKVKSRNDLSDTEKADIEKRIRDAFNKNMFVLVRNNRPVNDKTEEEIKQALEVAKELGIDEDVIKDGGWKIRTSMLYEKLIPLTSDPFGWSRQSAMPDDERQGGLSSRTGPRGMFKKHGETILRLAKSGRTATEIAQELGGETTRQTVMTIMKRFQREGKLDVIPDGRKLPSTWRLDPDTPPGAYRTYGETILRLAESGRSATEIAQELGGQVPRVTVGRILKRLQREGKLDVIPMGKRGRRWNREVEVAPDGVASPEFRAQFASALRVLEYLLDTQPALLGNETPEEMANLAAENDRLRRARRRELAPLIKKLLEVETKYPDLAKEFRYKIDRILRGKEGGFRTYMQRLQDIVERDETREILEKDKKGKTE
jgi:DNA-binding CsgD family transcriptional regulator